MKAPGSSGRPGLRRGGPPCLGSSPTPTHAPRASGCTGSRARRRGAGGRARLRVGGLGPARRPAGRPRRAVCPGFHTLVQRLGRRIGIPLTVCPLSNAAPRSSESLADHVRPGSSPRRVVTTINSDDPAYFGGYVDDNHAAVADQLGLDRADLARLAHHSVEATSCRRDARSRSTARSTPGWASRPPDLTRRGRSGRPGGGASRRRRQEGGAVEATPAPAGTTPSTGNPVTQGRSSRLQRSARPGSAGQEPTTIPCTGWPRRWTASTVRLGVVERPRPGALTTRKRRPPGAGEAVGEVEQVPPSVSGGRGSRRPLDQDEVVRRREGAIRSACSATVGTATRPTGGGVGREQLGQGSVLVDLDPGGGVDPRASESPSSVPVCTGFTTATLRPSAVAWAARAGGDDGLADPRCWCR